MKKAILAAIVVAGLIAPVNAVARQSGTTQKKPATAQKQPATEQPTPAEKAAHPDHAFVTEVAQGGLAEVKLGKLAADKGTNDQVKTFGQRMVTDHSKANDELKNLAQQKNIPLPSDLAPQDQALYDRLSKMAGVEFDREYLDHTVSDHRKDIAAFKKESTGGNDPDLKAWASKTLPTLAEHLKLAQSADTAVGTSGKMPAKGSTRKGGSATKKSSSSTRK